MARAHDNRFRTRYPRNPRDPDRPVEGNQYRLVYGRPEHFVVLARGSIRELAPLRKVAGDIIIDPQGRVAKGDWWLFPWEKENPNCYVRQQQRKGWTW